MSIRVTSSKGGIWFIEQAIVCQAAAYATGDLVGGLLNIGGIAGEVVGSGPSFGGGLIQSVVITDLAKQSITKDVVFFDTHPANTTFTENSALDIADADLVDVLGVVQVADWFAFNDNSIGQALNLAIPFSDTPLYAAIVERGAPTYASTSDLTIRVGILPA